MYVKKCIVCKKNFETINKHLQVCQDCQMDGSLDRMIEEQEAEEDQNRREHQAFRQRCCDDGKPSRPVQNLEFPNRIRLHRVCIDFYGKPIPNKVVLIHGPSSTFGVRTRTKPGFLENEKEIFGLYDNNKSEQWWVSLKDADLYALRQYGYSAVYI